ncbi:hypothetical protein SASPL_113640 [Salvia splendens]|uniref:Peptidoglycan binding-like domain-containing protein n=1 Tax=Salvia splendens TaxID=180675 RepID=A0A8X9A0G2_SALSN|nr:metalloendoproteinase 3-MMP-like [Salvia splendens]KAG6423251.1 hypothetical protein SASPL_113640 [Salvia splendens]
MAAKSINIFFSLIFPIAVVFLLSQATQTEGFVLAEMDAHAPPFDSKSFLQSYGYLEYARLNLEIGASEEQILELAIKTYQENFGISPTGKLDDETLSLMKMPRCGNPDIYGGVNTMKHSRVQFDENR